MYKENPVATLALNPHGHAHGTIQEETIFEQVYHFQNFREDKSLHPAMDTSQKPSQTMPMISFSNGFHSRQQTLLNETSNFQLPTIDLPQPRPPSRNSTSRMAVEPLEALPYRQRRNPLNYPIPLSTEDAKQNLRALAERKSTSPQGRRAGASESPLAYARRSGSSIQSRTTTPETNHTGPESLLERRRKRISTPNFDLLETRGQNKQYHLIIQRGSLQTHTELFAQYFQLHLSLWSNINRILRYLEQLMHQYTVPLAIIDGDRVARLEEKLGVQRQPTVEELFSTIVNREEVDQYIQRTIRAAIVIQSCWRGRCARQYTSYLQRRKHAARIIISALLKYSRSGKLHQQMKLIRQRQLNFFQKKQIELKENWTYIVSNRRTIIHLPSLGYLTSIRKNIKDLPRRENYQIGRLCDLEDPNVNIIYVSPLVVTDEILQYYDRLINLRPMVEQGNEKAGQSSVNTTEKRFTIIVPEAVTRFPNHQMCLATLLKCSPKALKQIKGLIQERNAYLISSISHVDDLSIAEYLNIPIFGCEPELSYLYSTKSGSKRIFQTSEIPMPFGDYDIYDEKHLYQSLTKLIFNHLDIQRWVFKIDDYFDGLGIAYCDIIEHLSCYSDVHKHASNKEKQNELLQRIFSELPMLLAEHTQFVDTNQFTNWSNYLKIFLSHGGIVEAFPSSDMITPITVSLAIEPDGHHSIICSGHQLRAESIFSCWGLAFPQSAVEPSKLNQLCSAIVEQCQQRHISGYIDVDFLLFNDLTTHEQTCWAIDLSIGYSEHVALYHVMRYVTTGRFHPQKHLFTIKTKQTKQKLRNWQNGAPEQIITEHNSYAIWSTRLYHSNFAQMSYSQFFNLCRTRGVGFDIRKKQGSIFTLIEANQPEHLGFITISDTIENTRKSFLNNLKIIDEALKQNASEISSNFQLAIDHLALERSVSNSMDDSVNMSLNTTIS